MISLGYKDVPPPRYMLVSPQGLPDPIFKKVEGGFRKAAHSPEFRKVLDNLGVPFSFKDWRQLEADFPGLYNFYGDLLKEMGIKKREN